MQGNEESHWYERVREIHDDHFQDPWQTRADEINACYGLSGPQMLLTHGPGVPLPWFLGDIEGIVPKRWVLAISLNHQVNPEAAYFRNRLGELHPTADGYWEYCRTFHSKHCYPRFFGPLAQVAAAGIGQKLQKHQACTFAASQMIFVEICPYGSNAFNLGWREIEKLLEYDLGFRLAREVNHLLIEAGQPALIMVNGMPAVDTFQRLQGELLAWSERRYESVDLPGIGKRRKSLRHWCGVLSVGRQRVPVVGFPFLRKPKTQNSNAEITQLGALVHDCVKECTR